MSFTFPARTSLRAAAGAAGASALLLGATLTAAAHVTVSPDEAAAGSRALLTFSVPHGCEGSPTTEVEIQIPEDVLAVTPSVNPNWDVEKLDADGEPAAEGPVRSVVYTARTPLPSDLRDAFELSVQMPDDAGATLAFPVVQTCEEGEARWDQLPEEGEDPHALDSPSPLVTVAEAEEHGGHGGGNHESSDDESSSDENASDGDGAEASDGTEGGSTVSVAGLGFGVVGTLIGAGALLYAHRRTRGQG